MADEEVVPPVMTYEEAAKYREELQGELEDLIVAQAKRYSKYKEDRIARLSQRLGVPVR